MNQIFAFVYEIRSLDISIDSIDEDSSPTLFLAYLGLQTSHVHRLQLRPLAAILANRIILRDDSNRLESTAPQSALKTCVFGSPTKSIDQDDRIVFE